LRRFVITRNRAGKLLAVGNVGRLQKLKGQSSLKMGLLEALQVGLGVYVD